jgi:hypothetical protein
MNFSFDAELWFWRGPAPFHFLTVPEPAAEAIAEVANEVTYGWGMIPVSVIIGDTSWSTSLWPKDSGYILPVKSAVRRAEGIELGDVVAVRMTVGLGRRR